MKITKVLLINPPIGIEGIILHPPLGIGYIERVLTKHNYEVKIIDMPILNMIPEDIVLELGDFNPSIIGIGVMTKTFAQAINVAKVCKQTMPNIKIVFGGAHPTFRAKETLERHIEVDYVLKYEAEYSFLQLLQELEKKESNFKIVEGLAFRQGDLIIENAPPKLIMNLDELDFPDRRLFPYEKYLEKDDETTLITMRGCPFSCKFCSSTLMGRKIRKRSIENLLPEIRHILDLGFKSIFFSDDTFTFDKHRVIELCETLMASNLNFRWTCNMRLSDSNEEMLQVMKKAGCYRVFVGIESGSDQILDTIHKKVTTSQIKLAVEQIKKSGIQVHASFALGMPGETEESIKQSIEFAKTLDPEMISFNILTPYPGTSLADCPEKEGTIIFDKYWYEKEDWFKRPIATSETIDIKKLEKLVSFAYFNFV
jgi:anaerobic magnesium-protoporphyrin IX monomethyl ester cyclase